MKTPLTRRARHLLLLGALTMLACGEAEDRDVVTTILTLPPSGHAFEPTLAIDPADPDHMIAAAMNGMPPVGSSTSIWVWRSTDGGRTWADGPLQTPRFSGVEGPQNFGADAVAHFGADGTALLASMSQVGARMGTFVSRVSAAPEVATSIAGLANSQDSLTGHTSLYDKPWMTVDLRADSPRRGTVYMSAAELLMYELPAKLGDPWKGPLISRIYLATSRDDGRTFSAPVLVSDSAFAAQLAVTRGGALEVTYARLVNKQGSGDAVFHRRSTDGGASIGSADTVTIVAADTLLGHPVLATRPNGDLLSCWSQGVRADERTNQARCATRPAGGSWSRPTAVDTTLPPEVSEAWPAVVGTERGWYLTQYVVGTSRTDVLLYRSDDGASFERVALLASSEGLGTDRFCLHGASPCRRTRTDGFAIGDYVTLAAGGGRLAAAYILPRRAGARPDSASVYVSILPEPPAR